MSLNILTLVFILSIVFHYTVQKIFIYFKKFDNFNKRSSHNSLATRTGGIGTFLTVLLFSIYYYLNKEVVFDYSILIPLGIMFIVGFYDDIYDADFKLKFLLQILVAKIIIDQGYVISNYHGLFGLFEVSRILAQLSTVFVFLVIVNSINFIDGIDSLAISEVIKILIIIELYSQQISPFLNLSLILISCLLPLYYFNNRKKRKVFLGDSGSLFLGTLVSIYIFYVLGDEYKLNISVNKVVFTVLLLIYPLFDLLRIFIIRIKNKKSPFHPDQNHLHHILHKKRFKPIINTLIIQSISILIFFIGINSI